MIGLQGVEVLVQGYLILFGLLFLIYLAVIIKLIFDTTRFTNWKIQFGLITPLIFSLGIIISDFLEQPDTNAIFHFVLLIVNLSYLLSSTNAFLTQKIYSGENKIIKKFIKGLISIFTSFVVLFGLIFLIFRLGSKLKG